MKAVEEVRFVATNFFTLQGLRMVPWGLCLCLLSLWANGLRGPAREFVLPALALGVCLLLLKLIDRYYLHAFGRVKRTPESLRLEWLVSAIGGLLALAAFWLDVSFRLPISVLGLVFALGLLADYLRINWLAGSAGFLGYYLWGAGLMALLSILPWLGFDAWWQALGIKHELLAITMAIGVFIVAAGIRGHLFLVHALPSRIGGAA